MHFLKKGSICVGAVLLSLFILLGAVPTVSAAEAAQERVGHCYAMLNENEQLVYCFLYEAFSEIANGERESAVIVAEGELLDEWSRRGLKTEWTREELGVESLTTADLSDAVSQQFNISLVMDALLGDCAFELFWHDKTVGQRMAASYTATEQNGVATVGRVSKLTFVYSVAKDYQPNGYDENAPTVNTAKTSAAATRAKAEAERIVAAAASFSDYEKLVAYRDAVCDAVIYDKTAVGTTPYGNPWQLVNVFDGDPDTNVVCEGYSKAFQYLCDLTDFTEDVRCYTVDGSMIGGTGAGAHMWNVVMMEDGRRYLVDITNSDSGSVGQDGGLFLAGTAGVSASSYAFSVDGNTVRFAYDDDQIAFWGQGSDSPLTLSSSDYIPSKITLTVAKGLCYDGSPMTVGEHDADICYAVVGSSVGGGTAWNWSYEWYADENGERGEKLDADPVNAGAYWLSVTAKRGFLSHSREARIELAKAAPSYTLPTGLSAEEGTRLSAIDLPDGFTWQTPDATLKRVGDEVYFAIFTPDDLDNYSTVTQIKVTVTVTKRPVATDVFNGTNDDAQTNEAPLQKPQGSQGASIGSTMLGLGCASSVGAAPIAVLLAATALALRKKK